MSRLILLLDASTVARNISDAYEQFHFGEIIYSGFARGLVFDYNNGHATVEALLNLPFYNDPDS